MPDHANNQSVSDKVTSSATFLSYYNLEASDRERREMEQVRLQYEQSMENSSAGQCYSTNYNKLLNAITMNRAAGHSRNHAVSALYPAAALGLDPNNPSAPRAQAGLNSAAARINQHLAVKHTVLQQALNATLSDYPSGDESDTICQILATNPHISVIVDHAVKLAAGTELFTVIVGPKVKVMVLIAVAIDALEATFVFAIMLLVVCGSVTCVFSLAPPLCHRFAGVEAAGPGHPGEPRRQRARGRQRRAEARRRTGCHQLRAPLLDVQPGLQHEQQHLRTAGLPDHGAERTRH